jgi:hypothetical protein
MGYDPSPHESCARCDLEAAELDQLFGLQFFSVSSARGYTTAGSFLRFPRDLWRRSCAPSITTAATSGPRTTCRARTREAWQACSRRSTSKRRSPLGQRFRGTSVPRPCPHAIAKRRAQAAEAAAQGDRDRATKLQRRVCKDAPEEPRHQLELGDYLASGTDAERAEAQKLWTMLAEDEAHVTSSLRAQAIERLARIAGVRGDLKAARALVAIGQALPIDQADR